MLKMSLENKLIMREEVNRKGSSLFLWKEKSKYGNRKNIGCKAGACKES